MLGLCLCRKEGRDSLYSTESARFCCAWSRSGAKVGIIADRCRAKVWTSSRSIRRQCSCQDGGCPGKSSCDFDQADSLAGAWCVVILSIVTKNNILCILRQQPLLHIEWAAFVYCCDPPCPRVCEAEETSPEVCVCF